MGSTGACPGAGPRAAGRLAVLVLAVLLVLSATARAAVITVNTANDELTPNDGTVSLREAIMAIDAGNDRGDPDIAAENPGTFGSEDTIDFGIPGSGRHVISVGAAPSPTGPLPAITQPVTINAFSQPGARTNSRAAGDNARLLISLDGRGAGAAASGLVVDATGVIVAGLDVFGFSGDQIELIGNKDIVAGNDIGFDASRSPADSQTGVAINHASDNVIGGTALEDRNVISGNVGSGVVITGTAGSPAKSNEVQGNLIGSTPSGRTADGNARRAPYAEEGAVLVDGGSSNLIGGAQSGAGNLISGNGAGVNIRDGGRDNAVAGNLIGVAVDGATPLGNEEYGVRIGSSGRLASPNGPGQPQEPPTSENFIGEIPGIVTIGAGNVIANSGADGVLIQGTPQNNAVQYQNSGNSVLGNSIYANRGLGIHLQTVTGGKPPNDLIHAPRITSVRSGSTTSTITGTVSLPGRQGMTVYVQLFGSLRCRSTGAPEGGSLLLGGVEAKIGGSGRATFTTQVAPLAPLGAVTATLTNVTPDHTVRDGSVNLLDTSQFSRCFAVPRR